MSERHAFRAKWHNYNGGIYFVTICCHQKLHLLGHIRECEFYPTQLGELVEEHINKIGEYHKDVEVWNYTVMPNHIHLVIKVGTRLIASLASVASTFNQSSNIGCLKPPMHEKPVEDYHHNSRLAVIIGAFKAGVTRTARTRKIASLPCWQARFHEHIIRNQHAFDNIMNYIDNNIVNWNNDCFNDR